MVAGASLAHWGLRPVRTLGERGLLLLPADDANRDDPRDRARRPVSPLRSDVSRTGGGRTGSTMSRRGTSSRSVRRKTLARSEPSGALLEERHALGELHVLVREPRDHRGVVEEDEEDEEGRNGE